MRHSQRGEQGTLIERFFHCNDFGLFLATLASSPRDSASLDAAFSFRRFRICTSGITRPGLSVLVIGSEEKLGLFQSKARSRSEAWNISISTTISKRPLVLLSQLFSIRDSLEVSYHRAQCLSQSSPQNRLVSCQSYRYCYSTLSHRISTRRASI